MFSKSFSALSAGKKAALLSVFMALSVVVNVFGVDTPTFKITLTYLVCFYAALLMGAVPAFLVGFLGDALGFLIFPNGGIYWLFGLTLGLYGFFAGVIVHYFPAKGKGTLYLKTAIAFAVCYLLITVLINTAVNYSYVMIFVWNGVPKKTFFVYFAGRIAVQTIVYLVNVGLAFLLLPVVSRLKLFSEKKST